MTIVQTFEEARRNFWQKLLNCASFFIPGLSPPAITYEIMDAPVSLQNQSRLLPGPERIRASMLAESKLENFEQPFSLYEDVTTHYDFIRKGLILSNSGNCLGYRPDDQSGYLWLSYKTVLNRSLNFGRGLLHLGVKEKEFVGIYSKNRVEWILAEQGLYSFSMACVALYDTLGPAASHFIITQADITTVVLETEKNLQSIIGNIPKCLKTVIYMDKISAGTIDLAKEVGLEIYHFSEVEKIGEEHENSYPEKKPDPEDVAILNYTSGTTGTPKGVMLTHANLVSCVCSVLAFLRYFRKDLVNKDDVVFSFLPLAHVYERLVEGMVLMEGGSIGFYGGDILKLLDDIKHLQPTIFPCVPRLLNRIYDKVLGAANDSAIRRFMIQTALSYKGKEVDRGIQRRDSIWDYLVFNKVQSALGGRVRLAISGGAPVNADVLKFFRCALGCLVIEGYGQTEAAAGGTLTLPSDTTGGHVGPPILNVAIKLVDVPEMNYFSQNDQGEICVKGPMAFKGYYKNPEETQKALDQDGWLHSGDIGAWLPNGALRIIDRKKNIFKLSQGEYVAPEKSEIAYSRCPLAAQVFVYGDSLQSYVVGVVIPDSEALKKKYPNTDITLLCKDTGIKSLILLELTKQGEESGLKSFEQVKDIYLHPELLTVEQGLLTPTMKFKRPDMKSFFEKQIHAMYNKGT